MPALSANRLGAECDLRGVVLMYHPVCVTCKGYGIVLKEGAKQMIACIEQCPACKGCGVAPSPIYRVWWR
jgi:DnaJ-class molecular chaperone